MSTLSSYCKSRDDAQALINLYTEQKTRMEEALSLFQTEYTDGFCVVQTSFYEYFSKLDEDNDSRDWEGKRVDDIRTYLDKNIKSKYGLLSGQYQLIINEMTDKISELQTSIESAIATRDSFQNLIDNYKEEDDE